MSTDGTGELAAALLRAGLADVDDSTLARALYSSDASLYRVPPRVVVRPLHTDDVAAVLAVAREQGVPVTMRGAGTSIAGNAVGPGIVVDTSKHLDKVLELDPEARTARVQPGTVHASLQKVATAHGLRFGPDPSTHTRCTIGGMIGNNACGSRALGYGRTSDNVLALEALTVAGDPASVVLPRLTELADAHLATIRQRFATFPRQVSGYPLEHLLPERGRDLARFLVGTEGTLAVVTEATVRLVPDAPYRALAVLGYPDMALAADDVPALLEHELVACEGLDRRITEVVRAQRGTLPDLPPGGGWIFAEVTAATRAEAEAAARAVAASSAADGHRVVSDPAEQAALWRIREDGAGLAARATQRPGQAGWEDAAVPPARLGAYLRDFDALLVEHGLQGAPYGHLGDGCVHVRIDFDLLSADGRGGFRRFVEEAADLVASYGGTLSGEHGDGRARSELLGRMYPAEVLDLFAQVKRAFDPDDLLNPGVLVRPAPFDADLRLAAPLARPATFLAMPHDPGGFTEAVHRCTGVGKCLADNTAAGGVMCPSYRATRDEKDSTRGRARVLQEMVNGSLVGGWDAPEVEEALDLCLACRGCARDCPTGVDMATYKAEALHQRYAGKRRPRTHYTLGRLPGTVRRLPAGLVNAGLRLAPGLAKAVAGVDGRRSLPSLARRPAHRDLVAPGRTGRTGSTGPGERHPDVVLWLDTFTDRFTPAAAAAALAVLRSTGAEVDVVGGSGCCGLTWLTTGQLERGRELLAGVLAELAPYAAAGVPVVVLEPSCLAVLRQDAPAALGDRPELAAVGRSARTLAEHLRAVGWTPPDLTGVEVVAQPHCHHASVLGWEADAALLAASGATVTRVGGCCGLAGDFGMEKGHYEVSVAVYEHDLGPAVRQAGPGAVVLADGFSCRTQLADLAEVRALHLAELLAQNLSDQDVSGAGKTHAH